MNTFSKLYLIGFFSIHLFSCNESHDEEEKNQKTLTELDDRIEEDLIEIMPNMYREYFPGKRQLKMEGPLDNEGRRHGAWESYFENGKKNSATYYTHGIRNGHSIVYHPNGAVYYYGEYKDDEKIGLWRTFDKDGNLISEDEF